MLVAINLIVGAYFMTRRAAHPPSANLTTPAFAVDALNARTLFYTPLARETLSTKRPGLLNPAEEKAFGLAAQNPVLWRQLDHRLHFDALLLSGDANVYRPLLQHLLETHDWVLTYLDQTSMIWKRRPATAWTPDDLSALEKKFAGADRALFLVGVANKVLALGQTQLAKSLLDQAIALDGKSADARTQLALYHAQIGQWQGALDGCNRALAIDPNFSPALNAKAQILLGQGRFDEALEISQRIADADPQDPAALFLNAKIAHAAHAFQSEIKTMRALLELAEKCGAPTSGYRIYLGQAYATDGQAQPSLDEFQKAAAANDLSTEQRKFVEEAIARIKSRTGS